MKRRALALGGRLVGLIPQEQHATSVFSTSGSVRMGVSRGSGALQARAAAMPAQQVVTKLQPDAIPLTRIDEVGAISIVEPHEKDFVAKVFENVDGRRIEDGRYAAFMKDISGECK
jgi:hypothetical protein